jgi:dTDP-4-dehydrorhamnose reductase
MKILLFGKGGQVGWELQRSLAPLGQIVALDCEGEGSLCGDFTDLAGLAACVRAVAPDVIVNAAAHTAVDKAESEPELARTINALAPGVLAEEADRLGAWLVHYSTDYVFDGSGDTPWRESDPTGPLGVYGKTKLAGEQAVARCDRHLIFRTSWVYAARGNNFARTMLRLASERDRLQVVADQIGAPTGADLLADVTAHAIRSVQPALLISPASTIWWRAAKPVGTATPRHVIEHARQAGRAIRVAAPEAIEGVPSSAYPLPAPRPHNSRLDTRQAAGRLWPQSCRPGKSGVDRMLAEILSVTE